MANILGATFYADSTQECCDCAEKRLASYGLACDEIKEVLGYQSDGFLYRLWHYWPIRYQHGKEYNVYFNDDDMVEYISYRHSVHYQLDMSDFTEQDNDCLIYVSHVNGVPTAYRHNQGDSYVLTENNHYVEKSDYEQLTRLLAKASPVTDVCLDIQPITDEYETKGEMLLCETCNKEMIEEMVLICYECNKQIAGGHTAYDIEYGNSLHNYNGMPRTLQVCLQCELKRRKMIDESIIRALMSLYQEHGSYWYANFAKDVSENGFYEVYEHVTDEKSVASKVFSKLNAEVASIIQDAYYEETVQELSKFKETCTAAITRMNRQYDY